MNNFQNLTKKISKEIPLQQALEGSLGKPKRGRRKLVNRIRKQLKVDRFDMERLDAIATKRGVPTSDLVRESISLYLKKHDK